MRRVEFPFVTGQQEGVDPKVAPAGTLVAARNVIARKDGMLVRRRGLESVSLNLAVPPLPGIARAPGYQDSVLCEMDDRTGLGILRLTRIGQNGGLADGARLLGRTGPTLPLPEPFFEDSEELVPELKSYAPVSPFLDVRRSEIAPRVGASGIPQASLTRGGALATLTLQSDLYVSDSAAPGQRYVLELRDPETMVVFHTYTVNESSVDDVLIQNPRLVTSLERNLCAVIFAFRDAGGDGHAIVQAYDTEAPYGAYKPQELFTPVTNSRVESMFADVLPVDLIVVATDEEDTLVAEDQRVRVRVFNWDFATGGTEPLGTFFDVNPAWNARPLGVFAGPGSTFLLGWREDDTGGHDYIMECEVTMPLTAGGPITQSDPVEIDIDGGNLVRLGATWLGDKWNVTWGEVTNTPPKHYDDCRFVSKFWADPDVALADDTWWHGALPMTSAVFDDGPRLVVVEVASGSDNENWLSNLESGVQVIDIATGSVLAQLAREEGGLDIWSGSNLIRQDGDVYYIATGLKGTLTGARSNALFRMKRGIPMFAQTRSGETLVAGGVVSMADGSDAGIAGFSAPPEFTAVNNGAGDSDDDAYYLVSAVLEVVDTNGRLWRSAPATPQQIVAKDGNIKFSATCGKGAPTSGDCFVAFYCSSANPAADPHVVKTGSDGAGDIIVTGYFGNDAIGDYELRIVSPGIAPSGTTNTDTEFTLRRNGVIIDSFVPMPDSGPFEYSIPDSVDAKLTFENGNWFHGDIYTWSNKLPLATTNLYRVGGAKITPGGESVEFVGLATDPGAPLEDRPPLYAQGGVLGNDAPPAANFLCSALGRVWVGGLPDRCRIQASKILVPELGVEWSNDDAFSLTFPEEVVGLAAVDDTLMVFTVRGVYLASGGGPDNRGIGDFYSSQRLPGTCGCVSARSIVVSDMGVFYQTSRGLEIVGRGLSGVSWIGQGVRDQVDAFPYCWGSAALPDGTIRFLMGGGRETGASVLLVWDQRSAGWYVYTYAAAEIADGRAGLGETGGRMTLANWSDGQVRREGDDEFPSGEPAYIETGWLRPAGINADHIGRRLHLLGQFLGPTGAAEVDIALAFDDKPYGPKQPKTIRIEAGTGHDQYRPGDPIELQVTLPVMHFSSVRAKVTWRKVDGAAESVALSGLTVFLEPNPEGQRVGRKSKR